MNIVANSSNINAKFFKTPNDIFKIKGFNKHLHIVYHYLLRLADNSTGKAYPSYDTIAKNTYMSRNMAIKVVRELVEMGLILKQTRTINNNPNEYLSNIYTILLPSDEQLIQDDDNLILTPDPNNIQDVPKDNIPIQNSKTPTKNNNFNKQTNSSYNKNNSSNKYNNDYYTKNVCEPTKKKSAFFNYNSYPITQDLLDRIENNNN